MSEPNTPGLDISSSEDIDGILFILSPYKTNQLLPLVVLSALCSMLFQLSAGCGAYTL